MTFFTPPCFRGARLAPQLFLARPSHLYFRPHPALAPYIAHYTLSPPCAGGRETLTLVPDASGCLVFAFGADGLKAHFWGPTTRTVTVANDYARVPYRFFVEFLPGGAHRLTGRPLSELVDLRLPLLQWDASLAASLFQAFESSEDLPALLARLDALFCRRLDLYADPSLARQTLRLIQHSGGRISTRQLSCELHYSARHLSRTLSPMLGLTLHQYLRLQRINRALSLMERAPQSLTSLAQSLGYYDQPHFIHDFKSVCGVAPTVYQQRLSDFYKESFKF